MCTAGAQGGGYVARDGGSGRSHCWRPPACKHVATRRCIHSVSGLRAWRSVSVYACEIARCYDRRCAAVARYRRSHARPLVGVGGHPWRECTAWPCGWKTGGVRICACGCSLFCQWPDRGDRLGDSCGLAAARRLARPWRPRYRAGRLALSKKSLISHHATGRAKLGRLRRTLDIRLPVCAVGRGDHVRTVATAWWNAMWHECAPGTTLTTRALLGCRAARAVRVCALVGDEPISRVTRSGACVPRVIRRQRPCSTPARTHGVQRSVQGAACPAAAGTHECVSSARPIAPNLARRRAASRYVVLWATRTTPSTKSRTSATSMCTTSARPPRDRGAWLRA